MVDTGLRIERDVAFGHGGGRELLCDVYTPPDAGVKRTAVILLYGGGWRAGDRSRMKEPALALAARGYVCVAPEYRLTGEAPWPANIHDVKGAVRWTRAGADRLGIDPARIALQGYSAGGHLALLAAATPGVEELEGASGSAGVSCEVAAAIAFYAPVLFYTGEKRPSGGSPASAMLGESPSPEDARLASPLTHVSARFPPAFLLHGTKDNVVPPSASMRFYEALKGLGVACELKMFAGLPHGFDREPSLLDLTAAEVDVFLRRHVVERERFAARLATAAG